MEMNMANRYGRNQKRKHRAEIESLRRILDYERNYADGLERRVYAEARERFHMETDIMREQLNKCFEIIANFKAITQPHMIISNHKLQELLG
jgi:hypothetical protein